MVNVRITQLPVENTPSVSDALAIDGSSTRQATVENIVLAGRPTASQAEAEAGTNPTKAMTPLTTAQAIAALGATQAQGAKADTALQPGDLPIYDTSTGMSALTPRAGTNAFRVNGYSAPGDGGEAIYNKVGSEPAHDLKVQTADGAWWEIADNEINVRMAGAGAGGDDTSAFSKAAKAAPARDTLGPPNNTSTVPRAPTCSVNVPEGEYTLTDTVDVGNKEITWVLQPGVKINGSDFINGRTTRPGLKVTHGYPYNILDNASGFVVTLGGQYSDKPGPVSGVANAAQLADYPNVDGVALIGAAYSFPPLISAVTATYTSTTVAVSGLTTDQLRRLRRGMVIETLHATPYIGAVDSWITTSGTTTITIDTGWYEYRNSAAGVQTPANGIGCGIGVVTKIWGGNYVTNLTPTGAAKQAIGVEISNRNLLGASTPDTDNSTNRVWGYLAASVAEGTPTFFLSQAAFIARGWWEYGYVADSQNVGYYYKTVGAAKQAIKTRMPFGGTILYAEDTTNGRRYQIRGTGDTDHGDPTVATGGGRSISFFTSGLSATYDARILATGGTSGTGQGTFTYQAVNNIFGGLIRPSQDNVFSNGAASFRWSVVFAGTGTINTSDERDKQDVEPIPDAWLDAWGSVEWVRYKWKDAVSDKGDAARWHTGLIAQAVEKAFADKGLDAFEIGLLCRDPIFEAVVELVPEEQPVMEDVEEIADEDVVENGRIVRRAVSRVVQRPKQEVLPVVDEHGSPVMEEVLDPFAPEDDPKRSMLVEMKRAVPVMETVEVERTVERATGETRYGLRYTEAFAIEAAWARREIERLNG